MTTPLQRYLELVEPVTHGTQPGYNATCPMPPITEELQRGYWLAIRERMERAEVTLIEIGQEADSWLRHGGDPRIVLDHIREVVKSVVVI